MVKFRIHKVGEDVVITRMEGGYEDSVQFPHTIFTEIVEEIREYPDVEGYPVELEMATGVLEIPYDEFFKLAAALLAN